MDMTIALLAIKPDLHVAFLKEMSGNSIQRESRPSFLKKAWKAAVRFWDNGAGPIDALYAAKFDNKHFLESNGVSVQYYGDSSAFAPASARSRSNKGVTDHRTLRRIFESAERFADNSASTPSGSRKAS